MTLREKVLLIKILEGARGGLVTVVQAHQEVHAEVHFGCRMCRLREAAVMCSDAIVGLADRRLEEVGVDVGAVDGGGERRKADLSQGLV
jgi:hypothetical protein